MTIYGEYKAPVSKVVEMVRAELARYPGRSLLVARIALACTSVMLLAEVFRIPGAVLGASFPILISHESPGAARKSAFQIAMACSIGTLVVVLGGVFTAGSPFLHVMWVLASLMTAFVVLSSLNFSGPALTFSAVIAVGIQVWEYPVHAETGVEDSLYTLLMILVGCLIGAGVETVFAKKDSSNVILDGISIRLGLVEAFLSQIQTDEFPRSALGIELGRSAAKGVESLSGSLARSQHEPGFHDLLATVIDLTGQLVELGSNLVESAPSLSVDEQERCMAIARNIRSIRSCLLCRSHADRGEPPQADHTANPLLVDIEFTVDLIAQSLVNEDLSLNQVLPAGRPAVPLGTFIVANLRDKEHFKFAVRGTLPTLLCYVFHLSIGWMGLTASLLTCVLTARRFTGASRRLESLRSAGFVIGAGVIGLGTEVLILPNLDSLLQFAILFATIIFIGSWVATSGPRIAFAGFQIVLAYNLVTLNRFTINTSLLPSRDVVLAVLLGVLAMWVVFDHLWAEDSGLSARHLLLTILRKLSELKEFSAEMPMETGQRLSATSSEIHRDFDKLRDLADMYAFEPFPKGRQETLVNRCIRTLGPGLRAFLFLKSRLLQHRLLTANPDILVQEVEEGGSSVLEALANAIETESLEQLLPWNARAEELRATVTIEEEKSKHQNNRERYLEMQLSGSLLNLTHHLQRQARLNFAPEAETDRPPRAIEFLLE
jgi:multidrug resistance protein MdtO